MEIKDYDNIKIKDMPIKIYKANCTFASNHPMNTNEPVIISGNYKEETIVGKQMNKNVGLSFTIDEDNIYINSLFIYHGNNPNKIFTTKEEAIAWSKKTRH